MIVNGIAIDDTFAEGFPMKATRLIITAQTLEWAYHSARAMTGFATSVIGCGCEAGIERELSPQDTPDGRPGVSVLIFAMGVKSLTKQVEVRAGQCVLTAPTSALFAGLHEGTPLPLGQYLRYYGDGFQISKKIGGRRFWRIPVMDGEFLIEEMGYIVDAVGGGNLLVLAESQPQALAACEAAVKAMRRLPNVILPFPGGVVRSGSKVGSKYKGQNASTNDAFCPTLKGVTKTQLSPEIGSVMEIVIDGLSREDVEQAMRVGIETICACGAKSGVRRISAGNYGGKLGPFHFHLHQIMNLC